MNRPNTSTQPHPAVLLPMILSLFYLSYLGLTSETMIYHDSLGYERMGRMLSENNWKEYFITGPNREPLYPLFVSLAMRAADALGWDYLKILAIFQIGVLILTQWLAAVALKRLRVSVGLSALAVAYLGFSPTLVNSGFILYSEILTYPLILWLILQSARAWTALRTSSHMSAVIHGTLLGLAALAITFTKGIFEAIAPLLLMPFLFALCSKKTDPYLRKSISILLFIFALTFYVPLSGYKQLNKIYNGNYALTDRGSYALYGHTARRMLPLNSERIKTAIANIPGADVCAYFYGKSCELWGYLPSDYLAIGRMKELRPIVSGPQELNDRLVKDSKNEILKNPLQYIVLTAMEAVKIFFWESHGIYCIVYPEIISNIQNQPWVRYPLRFAVALSSSAAFIYAVFHVFRRRTFILDPRTMSDERSAIELYLVLLIVLYTFFYSIFFITARYALPMAPLFLILTAWHWQTSADKKRQ